MKNTYTLLTFFLVPIGNRSLGNIVRHPDHPPRDERTAVEVSLRGDVDGIVGKSFNDGDHKLLYSRKDDGNQNGGRFFVSEDVAVKVDRPSLGAVEDIDDLFPAELKDGEIKEEEEGRIGG